MSKQRIMLILLSEVEELIYGYSVKRMAQELDKSKCRNFRREYTLKETYEGIEDGFILGFKTHQELVKDKFVLSEEQVKKIIHAAVAFEFDGDSIDLGVDVLHKGIIQSLLPKTEWGIEFVDGKIKLI